MDEKEYWSQLEYRLCDEFKGMSDRRFDNLWCDGFIPEAYLIRDQTPKILGRVWIVKVQSQSEWKFQLFLPQKFSSVEVIQWDKLFPPINMTKWLALDFDKHLIQIEPSAAVPDLT